MGQEDYFLKSFKEFSLSHVDFDFFYTTDPELSNIIFANMVHERKPDYDILAIMRSPEALTEFDTNSFVYINPNLNQQLTEVFFTYERYPKLRDESYADEIAMKIFHQNELLVVYIEPKDTAESNLSVFKEAIKALPKRFIYSFVKVDSMKFGSYMQYFLMSNANMEPDKVYIVYRSLPANIKVEAINGPMTPENVQNFVYDFYERNKNLFVEFDMEKIQEERKKKEKEDELIKEFV